MIITDNDRLLIEKYLDKGLDAAEKIQFDQRLTEPAFVAELALYQRALLAIQAIGDARIKGILQHEHSKTSAIKIVEMTPQYATMKPVAKTNWWALAAGFLLLVGAGVVFWLNQQPTTKNTEGVLATYFKPYPNYQKPVVRDDEIKDILGQAFSLYEQGKYSESLTYFERVPNPLPDAAFLQANAYLATQQIAKAIPILDKIRQDTTFQRYQQAEWYLALALADKEPIRATALFEKIKDTEGHSYQKQAIEVLQKD